MFNVEVVSPEAVSYTGEADMVIARTVDGGDIAFQAGHVPFIGNLAVWSVEVIKPDKTRDIFAVHRGFVQVHGNQVTILSDVSEAAQDIDVARAQAALDNAKAALAAGGDDAEIAEAEAAQGRAELRLAVSGRAQG
ncbi:MAG: ATP synthase F1 subunit epsilon [Acidimicrobiaceae bacterium]|nr:ATP synthase F1 subunit epsilon [Acidimicrobiaceae bacterium]MXW60554.1 ATP synthase F1 subunit epsilon [Acidimicrobiaceae bacterium]MXW74710.1 ATP synthase F1 subunit epsilon [Acidimicrobiaceae bacterium]MYA74598.1 ATP synthase F1 subunit epsilon [Acidimicrobiaceae bacterium]MYC43208.1 ATP synthase F1 subunit epsilon [Acidimicrobiaceae bacterium]